MNDTTEKIQAQRQYLDMLQGEYKHNPILIKIREGGYPYSKNEDVRLYKWMPYRDVWSHVTEPIYTRGIMPNEVFIDPDTPEWWVMQSAITRLLQYCNTNNIQYNECAFSGGKGIHVSFLVGQFGIPDDLENRIKSLNVDYMRTIRQTLVKELLKDTGIDPDKIGLDWKKINFNQHSKGSQVRCFGTTRKDGSFKTQIEPDKIPVEKPKPGSLPLKIPESIREWNITGTKYHNVVLDALQAECNRVEHANNNPVQDVQIHGEIQNFPCMRYIISNIPDMKSGRYYAAVAIVLLCEKLGYTKEETHNSTYQILRECKHFTPDELKKYVHNAMEVYGKGYQFSCVEIRDNVVGTGGCDKSNCPLSDAYREAKQEERIATTEAEREQGYTDICVAIKNAEIPEKQTKRTELAIKLLDAYCESDKILIEDIILDEMGETWGFNKTRAREIAAAVVNKKEERAKKEINKAAANRPAEPEDEPDDNIQTDESRFTEEDIQRASEEAVRILKEGDPLEYLMNTVKSIHVGDENAAEGIIIGIANQSCLNTQGIQVKLSGESGSGKTHVTKAVTHTVRKKHIEDTSLSAKAAYYMDLKPGTVLFSDDVDLTADMEDLIKRATTNYQGITTHTTVKDQEGKKVHVPPRIMWLLTSVNDDVSDQVLNRQLVFNTDVNPDHKKSIFEMQKEQDAIGEIGINEVTHEVLVCREIFDSIKNNLFRVAIPFVDDIETRDKSNSRNYPMFSDMMKGYAVLKFMQRDMDESGKILADREDFYRAKKLFESQQEGILSKLNDKERKILRVIGQNGEEGATINEIAKTTKMNYTNVRNVIKGRKDRSYGGLLEKVTGLSVEDVATTYHGLQDEPKQTKKADIYKLSTDFNPLELWGNSWVYLKSEEAEG